MTCKLCKSNRFSVARERGLSIEMGENREIQNNGWKKCVREWNLRWNQRVAIFFCCFCFSIFLTLVLVNTFRERQESSTVSTDASVVELVATQESNQTVAEDEDFVMDRVRQSRSLLATEYAEIDSILPTGNCTLIPPCEISCYNLMLRAIGEQIKTLLQTTTCNRNITQFTLTNARGINALTAVWFNACKNDAEVTAITIKNAGFTTFSNAFDMAPFAKTTKLILDDVATTSLSNSMFMGLKVLAHLELRNMKILTVQSKVFDPFKATLSVLIVENIQNSLSLESIIAADTDFNLSSVSFSGNRFNKKINSTTFRSCKRLENLHLANSSIKEIDRFAFDIFADNVMHINLMWNDLRALPNSLFEKILSRDNGKAIPEIHLEHNPWHCDASIEDLQFYLQMYQDVFDQPRCKTPAAFADVLITDISVDDLLPEEVADDTTTTEGGSGEDTTVSTTRTPTTTAAPTTPTTKPTTPTIKPPPTWPTWPTFPTSPTTEKDTSPPTTPTSSTCTTTSAPPLELERVECQSLDKAAEESEGAGVESEIFLQQRTEHFVLREIGVGAVELVLSQSARERVILWYHSDSKYMNNIVVETIEEWGCFSDFELKIQIRNLRTDTVYSFCVLEREQNSFSPFNCMTQYVQPALDKRVWLSQGKKMMTISVVIGSILLALCLGILITYFMLKKVPTLINGRHAENQCSDTLNVPVDFAIDQCSMKENIYGTSNYMSPLPKYQHEKGRTSFHRSNSDSSLVSVSSYISPVPPTPYQMMSWRSDNCRPCIEYYPQSPPPLPPHPNRKSELSVTSAETVLVEHVYEGINIKQKY